MALITSTSPEMTQLAIGLARRDQLWAYVHPFLSVGSSWERIAQAIPGIGPRIEHELEKRETPESVPTDLVHIAAPGEELLRAALGQLPKRFNRYTAPVRDALIHRRNQRIAALGAHASRDATIVVASHATALDAFKSSPNGIPRVLNYPSVHHRFRQRLLAEEARLHPELASTLPPYQWTAELMHRFDAECALADHILVGSNFARSTFIQEGIPSHKMAVVPYGVDLARFYPEENIPSNAFRVLFVGQIGQGKGLSYLLNAYRAFRKPDTSLTLIGTLVGSASDAFSAYRHLFTHIPQLRQHELTPHYQAASVFIFPSLFEGLGMVVLEAMASGVPVIASVNGPEEVVRDGVDGYLVPIRDEGTLVERLEQLYTCPAMRRAMSSAARRRAAEFTWHAYVQNVARLLESWSR